MTKIKKPCEYTQEEWAGLSGSQCTISNAQIANEVKLDSDGDPVNLEFCGCTSNDWYPADAFNLTNGVRYRIIPPKFSWEFFEAKKIAVRVENIKQELRFIKMCVLQGYTSKLNVARLYELYGQELCIVHSSIKERNLGFDYCTKMQKHGFAIVNFSEIPKEFKINLEVGMLDLIDELRTEITEMRKEY